MSDFQVANLPAGLREPGVYVTVRADGDVGLAAPNNRVILWGYMSAGGTGTPNVAFRAFSQQQVNAAFLATSMISHKYAAAKSQIPVGAEVWLMPLLEPSGGTAQVVKFEITGEPSSGTLSSATAAAAADTMTVKYRGRGVRVGIKKDDDWATIATNFKTLWDALSNAPASCTRSSAEISLTNPHKGAYDNGALEVSFESGGASGIAAKVGTVTFTGAAGVAATGSYTLTMGAETAQIAITDTQTAAVVGTALKNKLLSDSYPVRAAEPGSPTGAVSLFYVSGRPIRPLTISGALSGVTTQTAAVAVGTAGAGLPTLTSALENLAGDDEANYRAWSVFWTTTSEWSSTITHVEAQAAVPYMKEQFVIGALATSLVSLSSANLPEATTPKLSSSWRYPILWANQAANANWELSARLAIAVAATPSENIGRNWNRFVFIGSESAPLVAIHPQDRPDSDDRNEAIGLRHAPINVNGKGQMSLVWGGTSYKAAGFSDAKCVKLSAALTIGYYRYTLAADLDPLVEKKIKTASEPRTANATTVRAVEGLVYRWAKRLDDLDLFDGAEAKRDAIKAAINVTPTRIDVNVPFVPLADIDIVAPVGIVE